MKKLKYTYNIDDYNNIAKQSVKHYEDLREGLEDIEVYLILNKFFENIECRNLIRRVKKEVDELVKWVELMNKFC